MVRGKSPDIDAKPTRGIDLWYQTRLSHAWFAAKGVTFPVLAYESIHCA
jgi:hypothetical protein